MKRKKNGARQGLKVKIKEKYIYTISIGNNKYCKIWESNSFTFPNSYFPHTDAKVLVKIGVNGECCLDYWKAHKRSMVYPWCCTIVKLGQNHWTRQRIGDSLLRQLAGKLEKNMKQVIALGLNN